MIQSLIAIEQYANDQEGGRSEEETFPNAFVFQHIQMGQSRDKVRKGDRNGQNNDAREIIESRTATGKIDAGLAFQDPHVSVLFPFTSFGNKPAPR
jgi:hypothetical protein